MIAGLRPCSECKQIVYVGAIGSSEGALLPGRWRCDWCRAAESARVPRPDEQKYEITRLRPRQLPTTKPEDFFALPMLHNLRWRALYLMLPLKTPVLFDLDSLFQLLSPPGLKLQSAGYAEREEKYDPNWWKRPDPIDPNDPPADHHGQHVIDLLMRVKAGEEPQEQELQKLEAQARRADERRFAGRSFAQSVLGLDDPERQAAAEQALQNKLHELTALRAASLDWLDAQDNLLVMAADKDGQMVVKSYGQVATVPAQPRKRGRGRLPTEERRKLVHRRDHCSPPWSLAALAREFLDPKAPYENPEGAIRQRLTRFRPEFQQSDCPLCEAGFYPAAPEV